MEFRLIYDGPLPPENWSYMRPYARAVDKHTLRKHFHLQLRELWKQHPDLRRQAGANISLQQGGLADRIRIAIPGHPGKTWIEYVADNFQRCGGRFVPLV